MWLRFVVRADTFYAVINRYHVVSNFIRATLREFRECNGVEKVSTCLFFSVGNIHVSLMSAKISFPLHTMGGQWGLQVFFYG